MTFVTPRLHYANFGIEGWKTRIYNNASRGLLSLIAKNHPVSRFRNRQRERERKREREFHLSKGKGMECCQPSLRRIGLKSFFHIRVSDPLSSTHLKNVERKRKTLGKAWYSKYERSSGFAFWSGRRRVTRFKLKEEEKCKLIHSRNTNGGSILDVEKKEGEKKRKIKVGRYRIGLLSVLIPSLGKRACAIGNRHGTASYGVII